MTSILYKFRLYNLAFEICRLSSGHHLDREMVDHLDAKLMAEQQRHLEHFTDIHALPVYHVAHFYILSNYTDHLSLLLHRPRLTVPGLGHSAGTARYNMEDSFKQCEQSALKILSNFEVLYMRPDFKPYRWYVYGLGSFHAFLAITTLVVIVSKGKATPEETTVIRKAISSCFQRMQQTAGRSEVCAKASSILAPIIGDLLQVRDDAAVMPPRPPGSDLIALLPHELNNMGCKIWNSAPQLDSLLQTIPCEQWLMPSGFPWES